MKTIVGLRPTGKLHIGHYFSVIKPALEEKADVLIASYHAGIDMINPSIIADTLTNFGIEKYHFQEMTFDPRLYFSLLALARDGEMRRMTQYSSATPLKKTALLYTYPVLMAHDVANYDKVIVGEDQRQHVEFARTLLKRYNREFGTNLIIPEGDYRGGRIKSLTNPRRKMSKSEPEGCLFLDDEPKTITAKIMKAITTPAGIENLAYLYEQFGGKWNEKENGTCKKMLADSIIKLVNHNINNT